MNMPKINLEKILTASELELAKGILATRGKNKGCLRASKPKIAKKIKAPAPNPRWNGDYRLEYANKKDADMGKTAYIWRMVAFFISPISQHHSLPCTADFSLSGTIKEMHTLAKELDKVVGKIVASFPEEQWHGVMRWGQVFGQVGTPQVTQDGSVIYR